MLVFHFIHPHNVAIAVYNRLYFVFLQDSNYYCPRPPCKVAPVVSMYIILSHYGSSKTVCAVAGWLRLFNL